MELLHRRLCLSITRLRYRSARARSHRRLHAKREKTNLRFGCNARSMRTRIRRWEADSAADSGCIWSETGTVHKVALVLATEKTSRRGTVVLAATER